MGVYWPLNAGAGNYFGPWEQRVCSLLQRLTKNENRTSTEDFSFICQTWWKNQSIDPELLTRPAGHRFSSAPKRKRLQVSDMSYQCIYNNLFVLLWLDDWNIWSQYSHCLVITLLQPSVGRDSWKGKKNQKKNKLLRDDSAPARLGWVGLRHVCLCSFLC